MSIEFWDFSVDGPIKADGGTRKFFLGERTTISGGRKETVEIALDVVMISPNILNSRVVCVDEIGVADYSIRRHKLS
jgi:hypothetical protein